MEGRAAVKQKNVLIYYQNLQDITSIARKEGAYNAILELLLEEGRVATQVKEDKRGRTVVFEDGSKLSLFAFGTSISGHRFTHVYLDQAVMNLPNATAFAEKWIVPTLLTEEQSPGMATAGTVKSRIAIYAYQPQIGLSLTAFDA